MSKWMGSGRRGGTNKESHHCKIWDYPGRRNSSLLPPCLVEVKHSISIVSSGGSDEDYYALKLCEKVLIC